METAQKKLEAIFNLLYGKDDTKEAIAYGITKDKDNNLISKIITKGEDIYEMIDYFASRKKILYVHFRNVSGKVPDFYEEFVNTGYVDMYKAMKIYHKHNFDGFFIDDHVPHTHGDTPWGHRGRAFANGYIQAMIEAVKKSS